MIKRVSMLENSLIMGIIRLKVSCSKKDYTNLFYSCQCLCAKFRILSSEEHFSLLFCMLYKILVSLQWLFKLQRDDHVFSAHTRTNYFDKVISSLQK